MASAEPDASPVGPVSGESRLGQLKSSLVKAQAELSQFMAEHNQQLKRAAGREGQEAPDLSLYGPKVSALSEKLVRLESQIRDMASSNGSSAQHYEAGKEPEVRAEVLFCAGCSAVGEGKVVAELLLALLSEHGWRAVRFREEGSFSPFELPAEIAGTAVGSSGA